MVSDRYHDDTIRVDHASRLICTRCGGAMTRDGDAVACAACDVRVTLPTERTFGRFALQRELGRGGFGAVWLAWDPQTSRRVALKILRDPDAEMLARFEREARTAANLSHANIAAVFDVGVADGKHYIAFQYVEGETLAKLRLAPDEAADAIRDAARAVDYAHRQGVIHRDLKPQNLMRDVEGRLFVLDFGLARPIRTDSSITAEGDIAGTPAYMAPERALGLPADARTDVYGLGATLYQCLTGGPPYAGRNSLDVLQRVLTEDPAEPRRVDRDLKTIVLKAMERDPARRYASAGDLADDLVRARTGEPIRAHPPSLWYRWRKRAAKRKGAVAAAVALAIALPLLWNARAEQRRAERALDLWGRIAQTVTDAEVYARLGDVETSRRKLDEGIAVCRGHLDLPQARYFLGRLLHAKGRADEAEAELTRAIEAMPDLGEAHFERGLIRVERYESRLRQIIIREKIEHPEEADDVDRLEARYPELATLRDAAAADLAHPVGRSSYFREIDARYGRAELARLRSEGDAATAEMKAVLAAEPAYAAAAVSLARMAEEFETAVKWADEAIRLHAGLSAAFQIRSEARFWSAESGRRRDEATLASCLADIERAIAIGPETADMTYHRATVLWRLSQLDEAAGRDPFARIERGIADCDRLLKTEPPFVEAYATRALLWIQRGTSESNRGRDPTASFESAEADADRMIELIPRSAAGFANRGLARLMLAERRQAEGTLSRERVADAIDDLKRVIGRGVSDGTPYANLAAAYLLAGELEPALEAATRSVELLGDASSHVTRGIVRMRLGRIDGAVEDFERVLRNDPHEPSAILNLIEALGNRASPDDLRRAVELADRGVARSPKDARMLGVAGSAYSRLAAATDEGFDRAIDLMTRSLDVAPALVASRANRAAAYFGRGRSRARKGEDPTGDWRLAVDDFEAVVRRAPNEPAVATGLAVACIHLGQIAATRDPNEAREWFTRAIDASPVPINRGAARFYRSQLAAPASPEQREDLEAARRDLDTALAREPDDPGAVRFRGYVLYYLGDFAGALRDLERLPEDPDVRRYIDSCREQLEQEF